MLRNLHITNALGRNTTIQFTSTTVSKPPKQGLPDKEVRFRKYLAATEATMDEALKERFGDDEYGEELVNGDPEVDFEEIGRAIGSTTVVYLSSKGEILHAAPEIVEIIYGPDGEERERREPVDVESNINDELPVQWTGKKMPRSEVVRKFVFRNTLQFRHVDGVTYDFLYTIAKELDEEDVMVIMGAGPKGRKPLIFQQNGTPYRAFLEGRVDGSNYKVLLHLSNMELKRA